MYLNTLKRVAALAVLALLTVSTSFSEDDISLLNPGPKGGWFIFGYGVMDSASEPGNKGFLIDVDWSKSVWGVGSMFNMQEPINGKKLKGIRAKIRTTRGSQTKVFAAVSTKDDANLVFHRTKAFSVTNQWQSFTFPISGMTKSKPDITSRLFTDDDWDKIQVVKILFTKANSGVMKDKIFVQSPELIFN